MSMVITALLLLGSVLAGPESAAGPGDMRDLFNGKDLTDWAGDEQVWSVQDGVITGCTTADRPLKKNTFLIWQGG